MYNYSANGKYIGKQLLYLTTCHSTNDLAKTLNNQGLCRNGMVIIANQQTHGRGQQGTRWISEPDQNLTFSMVLHPVALPINRQFLFNKALSIHLLAFFRTYFSQTNAHFQIKWPNDIYLNGKKAGGLLIENTLNGKQISSLVIGIGLNVNQRLFEFPSATSLTNELKEPIDLQALFYALLHYIDQELSLNYESLSAQEEATIHQLYNRNLFGFQNRLLFEKQGQSFEALLKGVDEQGLLILETDQGEERFEIKSLRFLNHPTS